MISFKTFTAKVMQVIPMTEDCKAFRLHRPADFSYLPGQFITVETTIPQPDGSLRQVKRSYSLASTPNERDYLEIAIKKAPAGQFAPYILEHTVPGDQWIIQGAFGKFTVYEHEHPDHVVLIGAGSGIAPLLGLARHHLPLGLRKISLLYSNKSPESIIYHKDIELLKSLHPDFDLCLTITRPDEGKSSWKGEVGRIDESLIIKHCPTLDHSTFFLCGPAEFVDCMKNILVGMGVEMSKIKSEKYG